MKRTSARVGLLLSLACASVSTAFGDQLVLWNFNDDTTNPTYNPNFLSVPAASGIGGITASAFNSGTGSTDPALPNRGWQTTTYASQGTGDLTRGTQYLFNTTNFTITGFSYDLRTSNTSSKYATIQYTLDGTSWINGPTHASAGGDTWNNNRTIDFTSIAGASNNPNFGVRVVASFAPSTSAYAASGTTYATTGTWRFDMVQLLGTYTPPVFTARDLTWSTGTGAWDTDTGNTPWVLTSTVTPTYFAQNSGAGDVVRFNEPAADSVVTIDAAGVTPNAMYVANSNTFTLAGGVISGTGGLSKSGSGRLILAGANSFTSFGTPTLVTAGIVETRADNGLGSGAVSIGNAMWNSTTASQTSQGPVAITGPVTFETTASLALPGGISGAGAITKTGTATLEVGGNNTLYTGAVLLQQGTIKINNMHAFGSDGLVGIPAGDVTMSPGTLLQINAAGNNGASRIWTPGNFILNGGTIERLQITPGLGNGPSNADSVIGAYASGTGATYTGSIMTVQGNSLIRNNETRTAEASIASPAGANNAMVIRMPVLITSGATLTLEAINDQVSKPNGVDPVGNIGNTATALRAEGTAAFTEDTVTLLPGATLAMIGIGEKRIGSSGAGKPIVGLGTSASEAVFKADKRTYLTDQADLVIPVPDGVNTHFIVAGSGLGGLRVEGPMNANYAAPNGEAGFFGLNPDVSETSLGNVYTILSPNRIHGLSGFANSPIYSVDQIFAPSPQTLVRGGTFTIAASDVAGATGTLNDGPASPTPVKIGFDNTQTSGDLVYQLGDASTPAPALANFGGLVVKRTSTSAVTVKLLSNLALNGNGASTSLDHRGGTLDLGGKSLIIPGPASVTEGTLASTGGSGTATAATLDKSAAGTYEIASGAAMTIAGTATLAGGAINVLSGGALNLAGTSGAGAQLLNSGTLTISGNSNLGQNQIAADASGTAIAGTLKVLANGDLSLGRLRQSNLFIGDVATTTGAKIKLVESSPDSIESPARPAGNNEFVSVVNDVTIYRADTGSPFVGTLDITNNDLIIDYQAGDGNAMLAKIEAMVKSGYNNGTWTGAGITSSVAATSPGLFTVAVADNQQLGGVAIDSFDGIDTSDHKQILVKFTWVADINLDGFVNSNDAIAFATFYSEGLTGVHHQTDDLNYDGVVNSNDAILFATAYNSALLSLPEPTTLGLLVIGAASLTMRRRRA